MTRLTPAAPGAFRRRHAVPLLALGLAGAARAAAAASASEIDRSVAHALQVLAAQRPEAHALAERARGVLVFPEIVKAGLLIGGQLGTGALRVDGATRGYYQIAAASFGLQAGAQKFSMAMLFMTEPALGYLDRSDGWQVGAGPSIVVADDGFARQYSSTTVTQDVVVFIYGQSGLMAGIGIEGSKITRYRPSGAS